MSQRIIPFRSKRPPPGSVSEPSQTPGLQQASRFARLLDESRDLMRESLDKAVQRMLDEARVAITAMIDTARDPGERRLYEETRDVTVSQRRTLEMQFKAGYLAEFRRRSDRARKIGHTALQGDDEPAQLELIGEEDFDETLRCNTMAGKLRTYCDDELVALDQRVGVLLGDASLLPSDNPFSPQVICEAFKQACRQASTNPRGRRVLLKLFDDHVLDDVRSMYKAVNGLLIQNSILPKIRYGAARSRVTNAPAQGLAQAPTGDVNTLATGAAFGMPGPAGAPGQGGGQDLFSLLQGLVASSVAAMVHPGVTGPSGGAVAPGAYGSQAAAGMAPGGVPVLQGPALLGSLTQIQRGDFSSVSGGNFAAVVGGDGAAASGDLASNILHALKSSSVGAGMGAMDLMTLDIVAMLFDQLFDDPEVSNGVKGLIGRMQIPMLKVAIADKSFFSTKTHPARQFLDTLGDIASCLPADFGPAHAVFSRLEGIVEELVSGYQEDPEIFTTAREQLEALLEEEDRRVAQEANAAAKRVEEMEKLALAKRVAEDEVRARVEGRELPQVVVDFLAKQWLKLLLLIHSKEGPESAVWKRAIDAMDRLIWSIEPRQTHEERRQVVAVIPGLVKQLAVGMEAAGIGGEERSKFFAELMDVHRQAIMVSADTGSESAPDAGSAESNPSVAGGDAASAINLDFSASVTVKNPFGDGEVNVSSLDLDFAALEGGNGPALGAVIEVNPVESLVVGMWVEFREGDPWARRPGKLIFVTPRKSRYLFAFDRAGKDITPCTPGELDRRFRLGEATIIEEPLDESLFDRIMKSLVGKLRATAVQRA